MNQQIKERLIRVLGGKDNIRSVTNCMTRVRVTVADSAAVDEDGIRETDTVLALVHDRALDYEIVVGPGKCKDYAESLSRLCTVKDAGHRSVGRFTPASFCKTIGDIFVPLIPGTITAGICGGLAGLLSGLVPDYEARPWLYAVYLILTLIRTSFLTYITAWAGYRAAERFGATPILGGMLGMLTSLGGINDLSRLLGLYNETSELSSVLIAGRGGVLAVILGAFLLSVLERFIDRHMPGALKVAFTPLLTMLFFVVPYVLLVMPAMGFLSSALCRGLELVCMSENVVVRLLVGYIAAALFLPLVAAGLHHGLVGLYTTQLDAIGYVTLYPALCMAGAGQVGAALSIRRAAKKAGDRKQVSVIDGALPAGILGIGEPLIYGVTLPMGTPFFTAGLGAGFGGAFVMLMRSASTTWGPSGILGTLVMTAGPIAPLKSMLMYVIGLCISVVMGFLLTALFIRPKTLSKGEIAEPAPPADPQEGAPVLVRHGDAVMTFGEPNTFFYTIQDPVGIHARPAGALVKLAGNYRSEITFSSGGKTAKADSIISLMSLGAKKGSTVKIEAHGDDADKALDALRAYFREHL